MKLKAQAITQDLIPDEGILDLEIQLKELGLDEQKIREIVDSMKSVTPTTTSPTEPPNPLAPEEPSTGVQPTPNVLQPGMTMKRLQQKEEGSIEDLFEEKFEEYLNSGEAFDTAIHKSHKHLEKVVDYLEIQGQEELREPQGPAKHMYQGGSLYDQLFQLSGDPDDEKVLDALRVKFNTLLDHIEGILEGSENTELISRVQEIESIYEDLEEVLAQRIADSDYLVALLEEIKQVALDVRGGNVEAIDLGDWLY